MKDNKNLILFPDSEICRYCKYANFFFATDDKTKPNKCRLDFYPDRIKESKCSKYKRDIISLYDVEG